MPRKRQNNYKNDFVDDLKTEIRALETDAKIANKHSVAGNGRPSQNKKGYICAKCRQEYKLFPAQASAYFTSEEGGRSQFVCNDCGLRN